MNKHLVSREILSNKTGIVGTVIGILLIFIAFICSNKQSPEPEDLIKMFLEKHISLIDTSTANFYVKDEQTGIRDLISRNIQAKQEEGTYDSLKNATYDMSNIRVTVLDRKVTYMDDKYKTFLELLATGPYTMMVDGQENTYTVEETFVLRAIGGQWKITEKVKPWKKIL